MQEQLNGMEPNKLWVTLSHAKTKVKIKFWVKTEVNPWMKVAHKFKPYFGVISGLKLTLTLKSALTPELKWLNLVLNLTFPVHLDR